VLFFRADSDHPMAQSGGAMSDSHPPEAKRQCP
jgi:hypothetical protein